MKSRYLIFALTTTAMLTSQYAHSQAPKMTERVRLIGHESDVKALAFSPDSKFLASGGRDERTILWDMGLRKKTAVLNCKGRISSIQYSPDGKLIAVGVENGSIILWDSETYERRRTLDARTEVTSLAFSPDGKSLASTAWDGLVRLWDPMSGNQVAALRGHGSEAYGAVFQASFSHDGLLLATGGKDGRIVIWNTKTLKQISTLQNGEPIGSLNFTNDGRFLASSDSIWRSSLDLFKPAPSKKSEKSSNNIKIWEVSSGKVVKELQGHVNNVAQTLFFEDSKFLASASYDGTARIWNIATGKETQRIGCEENGWILSIVVSKDRKRAAFGGADFSVHLMDVSK